MGWKEMGVVDAVRAEDVWYGYQPGAPMLRGVSVRARAGALTAVVGPNGAGKTTLVRLLSGVATPDRGRVMLGDREMGSISTRERAGRVAYVAQRTVLSEPFTVAQVVRLGRFSRPANAGAVELALERMDLRDAGDALFNELSVGQQQRVVIARALAQLEGGDISPGAQVILADEPCSAMDPQYATMTMGRFKAEAKQGRAVVMVVHDLNTALRYADDAVMMQADGSIAAVGAAVKVIEPGLLERVFGVGFDRVEFGRGGVGGLVVPRSAGS